jgi:hypothetical protein
LLRRTFANFSPPERKKLGEKVKHGTTGSTGSTVVTGDFDTERAKQGLPVVFQLLGLKTGLRE